LLVALPALRVGVNLAIITLGAGVAIDTFVFRNEQISGGLAGVAVSARKSSASISESAARQRPTSPPGVRPRRSRNVRSARDHRGELPSAVGIALSRRALQRAGGQRDRDQRGSQKVFAFGLSAFIAGAAAV
jgi:hypothetical protein